jgi:hypothetical protein
VRRPWPTVTPSDVDRAESDAEETPALTHQLSLTLWTRTRPSTTDGAPPAAARLKAQEGGTGRRGTAGAGGRRPRCLMSLQRPSCSHAANKQAARPGPGLGLGPAGCITYDLREGPAACRQPCFYPPFFQESAIFAIRHLSCSRNRPIGVAACLLRACRRATASPQQAAPPLLAQCGRGLSRIA